MLVLTGAVVAGIPQIDSTSQAGGSADNFEETERVQAGQYIQEQYANATQSESTRSFQSVYV